MQGTIGIDLGGNSINVTAYDGERFPVEAMCELPARVKEGPEVCVDQLVAGFELALKEAGWTRDDVKGVGLDTPGPVSADGVLSSKGATNFPHPGFASFDIRGALQARLGLPVSFLNDGNAAALYAHWKRFKNDATKSSISLIIGTGLGGGVVAAGRVLTGRVGFAAELGHVTLPGNWHPSYAIPARCNCGKTSDLEAIASLTGIELNLLPFFLPRYPDHPLHAVPRKEAAKRVRGLAEQGDPMCREIFFTQTYAIAAHIDQMIQVFDPDAVFVGGGGVEASDDLRKWYLSGIRNAIGFRDEQMDLPIEIVPDGDRAGARGAAVYAMS